MIHHMVLIRFKPEITDERIEAFMDMVAELKQHVPGMRYFAAGKYASPEGLNQGYTHGFLITFESASVRDAYLGHPEHERVMQAILPHLDSVIAFDFEA